MKLDMADFGLEMNRYVDKKYSNKGVSIWVLHRRVISTAIQCVAESTDTELDASDVFTFLYHFSEGVKGDSRLILKSITGQVELAFSDPYKFAKSLYRFLSNFGDDIKQNSQYEAFFMAFSYAQEHAKHGILVDEVPTVMIPVTNIIINLFFETLEFLRPNKYNINQIVVGLSTDGKILTMRDPYPMSDVPLYHIEKIGSTKKFRNQQEFRSLIHQEYLKYGYTDIFNELDINALQGENNFLNNMVFSLVQYTNEYTTDILPESPFHFPDNIANLYYPVFSGSENDVSHLYDLTKHKRKRTLPANGAIVRFLDTENLFSSLHIKETYNNDSIILLYKLTSDKWGDISGYYNTKTGMFWSPFYSATLYVAGNEKGIRTRKFEFVVRNLVLWMYAAFVCDDTDILPTQIAFQKAFHFRNGGLPAASFFGVGGKLRKQYQQNDGLEKAVLFDRDNKFEEERPISGFVRRLPDGKKASEKAKLLAEMLGFELSENETYVQPFIRRQWLKASSTK